MSRTKKDRGYQLPKDPWGRRPYSIGTMAECKKATKAMERMQSKELVYREISQFYDSI